jgi:hypothetical protein
MRKGKYEYIRQHYAETRAKTSKTQTVLETI